MFSSILMLILSLMLFYISINLMFKDMSIMMNITILKFSNLNFQISMMFDWMSITFLSSVIIISSMILMFSTYYMPKKEYMFFFLTLLMFILSMSILILSNNLLLILLGWDMLGISSYILVIYYQDHSSAASGSITLLSNRMGDIFILLSISLLMSFCSWEFFMNEKFSMMILLFLLIAACTKSAQFPFSAWLPMAMSAPTPISALVHSSTLVTAGIYLMIRISNYIHPTIMFILMFLSSLTAFYASMSANWEQDLKKIIALSTLSQMAMMMFAISINSIPLAYFHLIIHAFFKSLMFMCAGIMIHEFLYQDNRMMSNSFKKIPLISSTLSITNMALMGFPFMSGFLSKDMIIEKLISSKLESLLTFMMISSVGMTASYSLRMMNLSNKSFMKSKPDSFNHTNHASNFSINFMMPYSIILGMIFMWMTSSNQLFIIPTTMKMYIIMFLTLGFFIGILLSFKSMKFKNTGQSAISLWFIHLISTKISLPLFPLMELHFQNDKNWQEKYGPSEMFHSNKSMTLISDMKKNSSITTLLMILLIPLSLLI